MAVKLNKNILRQEMRKRRDAMDLVEKSKQDQQIAHKLQLLIKKSTPKNVHCYLPMGSEVNILPVIEYMLAEGIHVITPRALPRRKLEHLVLKSTHELEDGIFGTRHPAQSRLYQGTYDLIIVPGLAFDGKGNRLGYGAGYYDSFLRDCKQAYKVGVGYAFQLRDQIPQEAHDVRLDAVIC